MATNICSRTRTKYATVKELAEELDCSKQQIYKTLKKPEMDQCKKENRNSRGKSRQRRVLQNYESDIQMKGE